MDRKWTQDELATVLFTYRDYQVLEKMVQREMRGGAESVLEPGYRIRTIRSPVDRRKGTRRVDSE